MKQCHAQHALSAPVVQLTAWARGARRYWSRAGREQGAAVDRLI
jgi:hypothetical protein